MSSTQKVIKIFAISLAVFIIFSILNGILFGLNFIDSFEEKGTLTTFQENYEDIKSIQIDLKASNIEIIRGENWKVEASNTSDNFSSKKVRDTLKIEEYNSWFWNNPKSGKITITVPKEEDLEELKIDSGAGKINIEDITSDILKIEQGAGVVEIKNSFFSKTKIDGGAGEMKITGSTLHNLDLDAGVGKVKISGNILGQSKIECGIGEIELLLYEQEENYRLTFEKGLGSMKLKGEEVSKNHVYGNGENAIDLEGGIGSMSVDFLR